MYVLIKYKFLIINKKNYDFKGIENIIIMMNMYFNV